MEHMIPRLCLSTAFTLRWWINEIIRITNLWTFLLSPISCCVYHIILCSTYVYIVWTMVCLDNQVSGEIRFQYTIMCVSLFRGEWSRLPSYKNFPISRLFTLSTAWPITKMFMATGVHLNHYNRLLCTLFACSLWARGEGLTFWKYEKLLHTVYIPTTPSSQG